MTELEQLAELAARRRSALHIAAEMQTQLLAGIRTKVDELVELFATGIAQPHHAHHRTLLIGLRNVLEKGDPSQLSGAAGLLAQLAHEEAEIEEQKI